MKPTNLSLAIFVALGVIACGGSGSDSQIADNNNVPTPPAQENPAPEPETSTDPTLVDPTQTHVVDNKNLLKESTVGALQYIRREGSEYDRIANPQKPASSTPLLGVSLDEQNPKLTNIVLARQALERADGQPVKAQFTGGLEPEPLTREGRPQGQVSLQAENYQNVDILAGAFKQFGSAEKHTDGEEIKSYAKGDKFDYDTHISDNLDKQGNHTRERVSHVYTVRYEYKQPFVDYPNGKTEAENRRETSQDKAIDYKAPYPPGLPKIGDLQTTLIGNAAWSTTDANDNSRHPVNIGSRTFLTVIDNDEKRRGSKTPATVFGGKAIGDPASVAWTDRWRNPGSYEMDRTIGGNPAPNPAPWRANPIDGNEVNWTQVYSGAPARTWYVQRDGNVPTPNPDVQLFYDYTKPYPNGGYPHYVDGVSPYSYRSQYPIFRDSGKAHYSGYYEIVSGYPDRDYQDYYATRNNTLSGSGPDDNDPKQHEHFYLEQEEFTAIRKYEPIRPLVNPIANEWDWVLQQRWTWMEHHHRHHPAEYDGKGNLIRAAWDEYWDTPRDASGTDNFYQTGVAGSCTGTCVSISQVTLQHAYWTTPTNQGGGVQGEFRGPEYWGWDDENDRTIRFNDERIWKEGVAQAGHARKYGANLIWWSTQDSAFENWSTAKGLDPRARRVDINFDKSSEDLKWGGQSDGSGDGNTKARGFDLEIQPTGDITNGLIRIGGHETMPILGEELKWDAQAKVWRDHHNTTSRIFGRYHLAFADQADGKIKPVQLNSYGGAQSFVSRVSGRLNAGVPQGGQTFWSDLDSAPERYSIGARPITLQKVQYGRVTSNLDLDSGEGPFADGFLHSPFARKNSASGVDNYFYRGVEATTVEQMAALPSNGAVSYEGHALMYGIDNRYKGIKELAEPKGNVNLPNAFALDSVAGGDMGGYNDKTLEDYSMGFGNFVQARVDFGQKKVSGEVYNAWLLDPAKPTITRDLKVHFTGDIMGNTVIGTADRVYEAGDDKADFRAAFFGENAEEMGGAFNSVTRTQQYGSAYEQGDWGGVFGARQLPANTFQGDDGSHVYGGGTP